jgi:lipopolysaccharide/colanic/teichoic acid biosynthesis glycosyltransferase
MTFIPGRSWPQVSPSPDAAVGEQILPLSLRPNPAKVVFDRLAAAFLLVLFAPLIGVIAALLWLVDGGPVLFAHRRVGLGGRRFDCLKFRTMSRDAEAQLKAVLDRDPEARAQWAATHKLDPDPRVHRLGLLLRKTSLDELPQLWNVLTGDMSLVGPRPVTAAEAVHYGRAFGAYMAVRPGITGLWQVSGRSDTSYAERVALDVAYVERHDLLMDLGILLRTAWVVIAGKGAR